MKSEKYLCRLSIMTNSKTGINDVSQNQGVGARYAG
jgi:hypothetical protein